MIPEKNPSPVDFYRTFRTVVENKKTALLECVRENKKYTTVMLEQILPDVARELGVYSYSRDYYTLDSIFYHEKDVTHFLRNTTYAKYISVALEHENNPANSVAEMNKLQLFNAPLKVLITYPSKTNFLELLEKYTAIIQGADVFDDIATKRRQLVIFGYISGVQAEWDAFVYQDAKFMPLEQQ